MENNTPKNTSRLVNIWSKLYKPHTLVALLVLLAVATIAYTQYGKVTTIPSSADTNSIVAPPATCNFYASPTGSSSGDGSLGNPWDLQTALNKTAEITAGQTLCLKGGTYVGKYTSSLLGGTVRSAPGEWAKLDGFTSTTLTSDITASSMTVPVADATNFPAGQLLEVAVDNEVIRIFGHSGSNNLTVYDRGASGSSGGAAAHNAGSTLSLAGRNLFITGNNTIYRDFEVTSSDPVRQASVSAARTWGRGDGVVVSGDGNKVVNLVIHDSISGIMTSGTSSNTEVYGNVIFNTGIVQTGGGGAGHGMYLENNGGYSKIYNNIVLNSFNLGMQAYGVTAAYLGGDLQDNVYANSGSPLSGGGQNRNAVIGPESQQIPTINIARNHFFHHSSSAAYGVIIGYGAGVASATVNDNYFIGSNNAILVIENSNTISGQGNYFYDANSSFAGYLHMNGYSGFSWNNNTYYNAGSNDVFAVSGGGVYNLTSWRTLTGFDTTSTTTATAMPNRVIVVPNTYETGRANVYIYNTAGGTTADIDLSTTGLSNGQDYVIRNPQNFLGSIITSGTFDSSNPTISVSLTGAAVSVATPTGHDVTPISTCPEFCPMVVLPTSSVVTPTGDTTPPVLSSGSPSGSQPAGTTSTNLTLSTNETATCKYGTTAGVAYASLPSTFTTTNSTSHSTTVSSLSNGTSYTYYIRCQDTSSNPTTQDFTISFSVANPTGDTTSPTVSLTAPSNSATVSGSSTTVSATASDNTGVVGVQFKLDGSNLGSEDTSSPYSIVWNTTTASNSTHAITAVARDAAGNSTTSTSVSVTVSNTVVTPPSTGGGGGGSGGGGGGGNTTPSTTTTGLVNSSGTYYLLTGGYRKGVTSPGIMYSCGFEFKDARTATPQDLTLPTSLLLPCGGALVKSVVDPTVYLVSRGQRYAFTSSQVFTGLGFKFSSVLTVTNPELQALPQGSNLSSPSSAHLPEVDININGTIYWLDTNLTKHPYPSLQVWNSWHRDGDFTTVVPANQNDLNLTTGSNVPMRF